MNPFIGFSLFGVPFFLPPVFIPFILIMFCVAPLAQKLKVLGKDTLLI